MSHSVVIVGAGQAGYSVAAGLRKNGFDGTVTLIGEEPVAPYQRPPLSKAFLLGELAHDRLLLKPENFFGEQRIELITGQRVVGIDRTARRVQVEGRFIAYDDLVLTTGSRPRRLSDDAGGALQGVHYLRTAQDAGALGGVIVPGGRLLVVGGGYVGLEVAAVAAKRGMQVLVIEFAPRILQRVASQPTSDFFRRLHAANGVLIREGVALRNFVGETQVMAAVLDDGRELPVDAALVGIGAVPNDEIAAACGLLIENGIRVDQFGRTSDDHIWAAGDCCSFPFESGRVRLESVPNAIEQADTVAANITGAAKPYIARPWFWSDQYDVKLQIGGLNAGFDRVVERPGSTASQHAVWYYRGERLIAVDAMNDARSYVVGRKLIEAGACPPPDALADPSFDLKALLVSA